MKNGGKNVPLSFLIMGTNSKAIAIFGNVTLDIICKTVDDVPRYDSIGFQEAAVTPGGCASNVAVGLARLGDKVYLIACTGADLAADFLMQTWAKQNIETQFVQRVPSLGTGISVGLVDSQSQPRFIHTSQANGKLIKEFLDLDLLLEQGIGFLHTAGYFVLPGLLKHGFSETLREIKGAGIFTSLDVVTSPAMESPEYLWPLLPYLDVFMCNRREAEILTGTADPAGASKILLEKGANKIIIKLGSEGCWLADTSLGLNISGLPVKEVVDTTGAGDAFAAGLLSALNKGQELEEACRAGIQQGAAAVKYLGAVKLD